MVLAGHLAVSPARADGANRFPARPRVSTRGSVCAHAYRQSVPPGVPSTCPGRPGRQMAPERYRPPRYGLRRGWHVHRPLPLTLLPLLGVRWGTSPYGVRLLAGPSVRLHPGLDHAGKYYLPLLDVLSRSPHESCVLPAAATRSGLQPAFPARPSRFRPFRLPVPHEPYRLPDLLCPLLTPASRSGRLAASSVSQRRHDADLPRSVRLLAPHAGQVYSRALCWLWTVRLVARSSGLGGLIPGFYSSGRGCVPRFLQTLPPDNALALPLLLHRHQVGEGTCTPSRRTCSAHH